MKLEEAAFAAFKVFNASQFGGATSAREMWDAMESHQRTMWCDIANSAINNAPPPDGAVDVVATKLEIQYEAAHKGRSLSLEAFVPGFDRFRASTEQCEKAMRLLAEGLSKPKHRLRLQLVSDQQLESEFQRLQPDGSVRELDEDEGTW